METEAQRAVGNAVCAADDCGTMVSVAVRVMPLYVASIDTARSWLPCIGSVPMAKVALVTPSVMVMLAGTPTMLRRCGEMVTTAPPNGAGALSVTVPALALPPTTRSGAMVNDARAIAFCGATITLVC